jgi:predicted amidohydrolase
MPFTIQLAQIEPTLGNLEKNLELHLEHCAAAEEAGVELLLFPELSLTGYFLKDQTAEAALRIDAPPLEALRERSRSITLGVGFVERAPDGRLFNSYAILEDGQLLHLHRKVHLVTYGMFEESRDVGAGEHFAVAESKHGRIGVLLCEDLWHVISSWLYFLDGVDLLVVPSAGPGRGVSAEGRGLGSVEVWKTLLTAHALLFQTWSAYVNRTGCEDGITFGGGSRIVDPFGEEVACLEGLAPGSLTHEIDLRANERARVQTPLRRDEKPWIVLRELQRLEEAER